MIFFFFLKSVSSNIKNTNAEEGWWDEGMKGEIPQQRSVKKNTQAHTPAMRINFKAEVKEISIPVGPGFLVLGKNKYTKVKREEITSLREKKNTLVSNLQIKKQSNQSCQRTLIPGCSYQAAAE